MLIENTDSEKSYYSFPTRDDVRKFKLKKKFLMKILTFDIEEWFHILDNDSTKTVEEWSNYETRIHSNVDKIFNLLAKSNLKATFLLAGLLKNTQKY